MTDQPDDLTGAWTPDPPIGCLTASAEPTPATLAAAVEVRDPCPHCESSPDLIPRRLMAAHIAETHPEVGAGGPGSSVPDAAVVCGPACAEQHTYDWTCELFAGIDSGSAPDELTAEEARDLADELGTELYQAQDALAFVEECCVIAEREQRAITVADVREWLKGARCGRQFAADTRDGSGLVIDPNAPPLEFVTWSGSAVPRFTAHPVTPEMERAATARAVQAAADSARTEEWIRANSAPESDGSRDRDLRVLADEITRLTAITGQLRALATRWQATVRPGEPHPAAAAILNIIDGDGPTVREAARDDRRWPLEREGE